MRKIFILFFESTAFALGALRANLLRTLLSLLGVTVGIFAIIAVFTLVDSLELNIRQSMSFFGDRVIYVQKWPWIFEKSYPWYKYVNRPVSSVADFRFLEKNLQNAEAVALYASKGDRLVKHENNSIEGIRVMASPIPSIWLTMCALLKGATLRPANWMATVRPPSLATIWPKRFFQVRVH